jgi:hypothetical protein
MDLGPQSWIATGVRPLEWTVLLISIDRLCWAAFKRQVAEEFIAGETLHGLAQRHHILRQLIRVWIGKFEAGALEADG